MNNLEEDEAPYQLSNSLYIGDIDKLVTEKQLYEIFKKMGDIQSVNICRQNVTNESLGYGYISYSTVEDAQRAMKELNFTRINDREIRVMNANRDERVRRNGKGNLFVKNLDKSIDNKTLYNFFNSFGPIMSCKVACDSLNKSKGYGFIHFRFPKDAEKALKQMNQSEIASKTVDVCYFMPSSQRKGGKILFTNIYVKNFDEKIFPNEKAFREFFEKYGTITSVCFPMTDKKPSPLKHQKASQIESSEKEKGETESPSETLYPSGFAFVNFADSAVAKKVVEEFKNQNPPSLYIRQAVSKAARQNMLRLQKQKWQAELDNRTAGRNVFVKNLPDEVDDELLHSEFSKFGQVEKAKVSRDENDRSKCFGFVLFSKPLEAARAINENNGKKWEGKTLGVTIFQRKELRQQQFEKAQAARKNMTPQQQQQQQQQQQMAQLYQNTPPMIYTGQPQIFPNTQMIYGAPPMQPHMQQNEAMINIHPGQNSAGYIQQNPQYQHVLMRQSYPNQYPSQMEAEAQSRMQQMAGDASGEESNTMMGEIIFKKVAEIDPDRAGKITGMFLDMNTEMLVGIINDENTFRSYVMEAIKMLDANDQE